ncbi:MAG: hypothetical protein RLZZ258_126 [Actinomycetota bacterium]
MGIKSESLDANLGKSLLQAFAVSKNGDSFCKHVVHRALQQLGVIGALICTVSENSQLSWTGCYGVFSRNTRGQVLNVWDHSLLTTAIVSGKPQSSQRGSTDATASANIFNDTVGESFLALPFSANSKHVGAIGLVFGEPLHQISIGQTEFELLQLAAEIAADIYSGRRYLEDSEPRWQQNNPDFLTLDQLSERQLKVLVAIGKGMTNREIGVLLNLSESSIKQESSRIFKVLGAKSRYQAVKLARQQGVI